uniref:Thioredoxin-like 1-1ic n=1 Tax=Rhizophora mucronata TaxID=61149 RepID=A0A2P2JQA6_RHIMU
MALLQIKKFKDALAKHMPDQCSLSPAKGLEEKELLALAANKDLSFTYAPKAAEPEPAPTQEEMVTATATSQSNLSPPLPLPLLLPLPTTTTKSAEESMEKTLVTSGR